MSRKREQELEGGSEGFKLEFSIVLPDTWENTFGNKGNVTLEQLSKLILDLENDHTWWKMIKETEMWQDATGNTYWHQSLHIPLKWLKLPIEQEVELVERITGYMHTKAKATACIPLNYEAFYKITESDNPSEPGFVFTLTGIIDIKWVPEWAKELISNAISNAAMSNLENLRQLVASGEYRKYIKNQTES